MSCRERKWKRKTHSFLDEIKENEVPKAPKNQEQQHVLETPATVRKYTRLSRTP